MAVLGGPALWVELIQSDEEDRVIEIPASDLASFEFIDTDTGTDVAKLSLRNDDMKWYDEGAFRAGQKLNIIWGWESAMCTPRRMVVKKPSRGSNPIVITLHDEGTLLDLVPKKRHWEGMTDSQIASAIADENGYTGIMQDITDAVAVREGTTQLGTDAAFLSTLARRNGYRWWVDGMGLHWGARPTGAEPSAYFIYRHDLRGNVLSQPEIKANLAKDIAMVKVVAIDPLTHEEVVAEVGVDEGDETLGEYLQNMISLGKEEEVENPKNNHRAQKARAKVRAFLSRIDKVTQEEFEAMINSLEITKSQKAEIEDYLGSWKKPTETTLNGMMAVINKMIPVGSRATRVSRSAEYSMGSATAEEVATEATRIYQEVASKRYEMSVPILGDPTVGAKQLHHWTMPSETMSGLWYCKKAVTHITPGSYRIDLEYIKDALGKLFLKKTHPVSRKKNLSDAEAEKYGVDQEKDKPMKKTLTISEENGQPVAAYHYIDSSSNTVGKAVALTSEEIAGLTSRQRLALAEISQGSVTLPGK